MGKRKRVYGLIAALVAVFVLPVGIRAVLKLRPAGRDTSHAAVVIDNFSFSPATITVSLGTTVTWTNHDDVPHEIVSDDKAFKSGGLDTDDRYSHTFTKPGTYNYFCAIHPKMTAKIVVQ